MLRVDPGLYPSQAKDLITSSILYKVPEISISPSTSKVLAEVLSPTAVQFEDADQTVTAWWSEQQKDPF